MMLNFRKVVLEIWLKRYNSHVFPFAETNASQVNGEMCPLSFQILGMERCPPCSSVGGLKISNQLGWRLVGVNCFGGFIGHMG